MRTAEIQVLIMKFDISHLILNNALKYRLMFAAGGIVHAGYMLIFLSLGIMPLVVVNVCSVLLYILGSLFSVNKKTRYMRYGWMIAFYVEVLVHSVLCMLLIGVDTNFYLYALAIMPVSVYVLFRSCSIKKFLLSMAAMTVTDIVVLIGTFFVEREVEMLPYYPLTYDEVQLFRMTNAVVTGIILILFSFMFAIEMHFLLEKLAKSNERLRFNASHDALTGLLNRRALKPIADKLSHTDEIFCVALGDIDDFKQVNDTYGHSAGDTALKTVAEIIRGGVNEDDLACRWGGEELLLVMRGNRESCLQRLTAIWQKIGEAEMKHDSGTFSVTITFGFVTCEDTRNIEKLVTEADNRLYIGKSGGKNVIISE